MMLFLACLSAALHLIPVTLRFPIRSSRTVQNDRLDPWQIGFNEFPFSEVYRGIAGAFGRIPPSPLFPSGRECAEYAREISTEDLN